jgi:hypothetical protein
VWLFSTRKQNASAAWTRPAYPTAAWHRFHRHPSGEAIQLRKVERSHRIASDEFYRLLEGQVIDGINLFNNNLQEWEVYYNFRIDPTEHSQAAHPPNASNRKPKTLCHRPPSVAHERGSRFRGHTLDTCREYEPIPGCRGLADQSQLTTRIEPGAGERVAPNLPGDFASPSHSAILIIHEKSSLKRTDMTICRCLRLASTPHGIGDLPQ